MTCKWARWRELTPAQRRVLFQALLLLPVASVGLRLLGLRRMRVLLGRPGRGRTSGAAVATLDAAREVAGMVDAAGRHGLLRPNCLQRSLVLWALLCRRGIHGELCIGVRQAPGVVAPQFHAWVECGRVVINDKPDVRRQYRVFDKPGGSEPGGLEEAGRPLNLS